MSNYDKFKEKSQTFFRFFVNNTTKKGANITYLVVWNLILIFLVIGLIGASFAGGAGAGYFAALVKEEPIRSYEDMRTNIYNYEESTEMYFAGDVYLGKYRADLLREEVSLDNVSEHLINALISTEDEYFYEHEGVVPKAIVRAIVQEVTNSANQTGGSTLTQQLIKNQVLTNEVSFDRKAKEILLALRLENYFSKEEILEAYLNVSPFGRDSNGRNIAGAQTAAEGIFGVDISELTIPQAAFIAGLPQSPFAYTPFTRSAEVKTPEGLEPGLERMRYVLHRMHAMGHIDAKQHEEALAYDITKDLAEPTSSAIDDFPYVAFEIEERAQEIIAEQLALNDGYEKEDLLNNDELYKEYKRLADTALRQKGYVIKTTIDKDIYTKMREITQEFPYFNETKVYSYEEEKDPDTGELVAKNAEQVGALMMDNKTGAIISFVGGRDFKISDLNFSTNTWRHNGSTMKPLLGYAPAYELGTLQPGSILADTPLTVNIPGQPTWSPNNWNNTFNGLQTVRESVALSHNLAAIRGYMEILPQRPMEYLFKQNFEKLTQGDAANISAVLGSPSIGVSVEENTAGYVTFANGGNYVEPYLIESITTKDGDVIYEHKVEPVEIYSPQTAYLMIDTMRDTFRRGTANVARDHIRFGSDWAGKTGTTQDTHDIWMMGSNPNITFGLWMGYDERHVLKGNSGRTPTQRSQILWAQLLNGAYDINPELVGPSEQFQMPGGIVRRSYCKLSGLLPSSLCQKAGLVGEDIFNAKYAPTKTDDSLTTGKYVQIGDVAYAPLSSTPSEFVKEGPMIKPDFLKKLQVESLEELAKYMKNKNLFDGLTVLSDDPLPANNSAPKQVGGVNASGSTLTWSASSEKDVIGYYVYYKANSSSSARKIASVQAGENMSTKISQSSGYFYVTAVNASGKESAASSSAKLGDPDKKEKPKPKPKPDPKPPSNGGGNGNGGGGNDDGGNDDDDDDDGDDNSTDPPPDDSGDDGED
ncbi:peptidoglycan glycosyltransferase [Bacillus sp. LL01]|uniref:transglycosylase domain-containing protein n=1 Tax=Bacillus sp. LL01 TaxID=1665556 RepID=UPI00064D0E23|nr:transglycosylase domain-containing protein [Bacillus sp. LL01]KMJ57063.1 peptidoglycan glycosyltransferase [Bacillus sp. LL01]